jgi:hypothetical protein
MVGLTARVLYKKLPTFVVCVVCRRRQVVDWCLLVLVLDCLSRKQFGLVYMGSVGFFYWWWMVISREVFNRIDRHCNVHPWCSVVPIELDAAV